MYCAVLTALLLPTSLQVSYSLCPLFRFTPILPPFPANQPFLLHSPDSATDLCACFSKFTLRPGNSKTCSGWSDCRGAYRPFCAYSSVLCLGTELRQRSTSLFVCIICRSLLLLIAWQVNAVCVFHSTDPGEYCVYIRLSGCLTFRHRASCI